MTLELATFIHLNLATVPYFFLLMLYVVFVIIIMHSRDIVRLFTHAHFKVGGVMGQGTS